MHGNCYETAPSVRVTDRQGERYILTDLLTERRFEVSADVARLIERLRQADPVEWVTADTLVPQPIMPDMEVPDPEIIEFLLFNELLVRSDQPLDERVCRLKPVRPRLFQLPQDTGSADGRNLRIIGLPFGGGNPNRNALAATPDALRKYAHDCRIDHRSFDDTATIESLLDLAPLDGLVAQNAKKCISDGGNLSIYSHESSALVYRKIEILAGRIFTSGDVPLFLGGDHSITLPILRASSAHGRDVGLIQIDAHTDTYMRPLDQVYASLAPHNHANFVSHTLALEHIASVDQFGIRGLCNFGEPDNHPKHHVHMMPAIRKELQSGGDFGLHRDRAYYLSIDIDAIDPILAPASHSGVPGGFTSNEFFTLLYRLMQGRQIIGIDLVELDARLDVQNRTLELALQILIAVMSWWDCSDAAE